MTKLLLEFVLWPVLDIISVVQTTKLLTQHGFYRKTTLLMYVTMFIGFYAGIAIEISLPLGLLWLYLYSFGMLVELIVQHTEIGLLTPIRYFASSLVIGTTFINVLK